jgi:hypothetical protein
MADHAVFLVHGLWGNKAHFWFVEEQLRLTHPSLKIHSCGVNEGNKTYDGIDVGGDRVVAEVFSWFSRRLIVDCGDVGEMERRGVCHYQILDRGIFVGFDLKCGDAEY